MGGNSSNSSSINVLRNQQAAAKLLVISEIAVPLLVGGKMAQSVPRGQNSVNDCCDQGNMQAGNLFPSIHSSTLFMGLLFPKKTTLVL